MTDLEHILQHPYPYFGIAAIGDNSVSLEQMVNWVFLLAHPDRVRHEFEHECTRALYEYLEWWAGMENWGLSVAAVGARGNLFARRWVSLAALPEWLLSHVKEEWQKQMVLAYDWNGLRSAIEEAWRGSSYRLTVQ